MNSHDISNDLDLNIKLQWRIDMELTLELEDDLRELEREGQDLIWENYERMKFSWLEQAKIGKKGIWINIIIIWNGQNIKNTPH